jgi:dihydroxyacetone kinase DhaKLM complex PTS-EIIA-like component DhaM
MKKFAGSLSELRKQMAEKAVRLSHESGMNTEEGLGAKKRKMCRCCQKLGHLTTKAEACKHYKLTVEQVQAEMVSNHALKAAETAVLVAGPAATAVQGTSEAQSEG